MNSIPPLDLTRQYETIRDRVNTAVLDILASGRYIGGSAVDCFEERFAAYIGVPEAVSCNSGTDALFLALRASDIGPGDRVITTAFSFIATSEVITAVGATPVFVDIDPETFNLDLDQVEAAVTPETRAIVPVHLFGRPVDMTRLMAIARKHNLVVIEDCAQATGATWEGKKVGSFGHFGCFSFFPTKNLGACGDGGAVTTSDPTLAEKIQVLKNHGQTGRYNSEVLGINSRLDAVQAAILTIKLDYLDRWNERRRAIATRYGQLLEAVPGIVPPRDCAGGRSVWNQYTIRVGGGDSDSSRRDRLREDLQKRGVSTMVYYPIPLHRQGIHRDLGYQTGQLPVAEQIGDRVLSLPLFPELSEEQQDRVIYSLKDCLKAVAIG
ncbi:MAG: DegT/DnrJ/EryC1/StrS family aminotransferase [Limnospira sp.]